MYNTLDSTSLDTDDHLTALLNFYSPIITDRRLKFNILSKSNISEQVTAAIHRSLERNSLLRFTDNVGFSVFIPTDEIAVDSPYSVRFISDHDKRRSVNDSNSDDDFDENLLHINQSRF